MYVAFIMMLMAPYFSFLLAFALYAWASPSVKELKEN